MAKSKRKTLPKDFEEFLAAGDLATLKAVFAGCDVDARGGVFKQSALAFAACPDELTRWLVEQGADLSATDAYGETPLHARAGHWKGDVALLIALGADVNHDAGGRGTPLHRAAAVGNLRTARALLDHGARVDAINDAGQTPLLLALQRCSNATIARIAPMARMLLDAMAGAAGKPRSFVGSLFGARRAPASPVTPATQHQVRRIGTDFEFHRANFNPDSVDAASDALAELYRLFDVAPMPRRVLHDGTSPIVARAIRWEDRHQELWEMLVPSSGAAATVQGEIIRISGRISDEIDRNGSVNWDGDYRKMADALLDHIGSAHPLPPAEQEAARKAVAEVKRRRDGAAMLCQLAVEWVALNPTPIALPQPAYRR